MCIYIPELVDYATKKRLLDLMAGYRADTIAGHLGEVAYGIIKSLGNPKDGFLPPLLDALRQSLPDARVIDAGFLMLLSKYAELSPVRKRWLDGSKEAQRGELDAIVLAEMASLSDPVKINTWAATCEEWMQLCNLDDLKEQKRTVDWLRYSAPPEDEEDMVRWNLKYYADLTYFY